MCASGSCSVDVNSSRSSVKIRSSHASTFPLSALFGYIMSHHKASIKRMKAPYSLVKTSLQLLPEHSAFSLSGATFFVPLLSKGLG